MRNPLTVEEHERRYQETLECLEIEAKEHDRFERFADQLAESLESMKPSPTNDPKEFAALMAWKGRKRSCAPST